MKSRCLVVVLALLIVTAAAPRAAAQGIEPAWPQFDSFRSLGFESINRLNLSTNFSIPIFARKGRGLDFKLALDYHGRVWTMNGSFIEPVAGAGWTVDSAIGSFLTSGAGGTCGYPAYYYDQDGNQVFTGGDDGSIFWSTTGYQYVTASGTVIPNMVWFTTGSDDPATDCPANSGAESSTDASSGITIAVDDYGQVSASDLGGHIMTPYGITDRNGNRIIETFNDTWNSGRGDYLVTTQWFDTLNAATPVMTMSGYMSKLASTTFSFTAANGAAATATANYAAPSVSSGFNCGSLHDWSGTAYLLTGLSLPNAAGYQFAYDSTAHFTAVTLPTGGTIHYQQYVDCTSGLPKQHLERWDSTNLQARHWVWEMTPADTQDGSSTTVETDPLSNAGTYTFNGSGALAAAALGNLTETICYNGNCAANPVGGISERQVTTASYLPGFSMGRAKQRTEFLTFSSLPTEVDETDWGPLAVNNATPLAPGPLLRKTLTTYAQLGEPASVTVTDGNGNQLAATCYTYDQGTPAASSGIANHVAPPGAARGNLTSLQRLLSGTCSSGPVGPLTQWTYEDTGQPLTMTDPLGHLTQYDYTDNFSGTAPPAQTHAFPTTITYPHTANAAHIEHFGYLLASGAAATHTDQNGQTTTTKYADLMGRPTEVDYPDGGVTAFFYNDSPSAVTVETQRKLDGSRWTDAFTAFDPLGRPLSQASANGESSPTPPWDRVDTCYDASGAVGYTSYPYQASSATAAIDCSTPPNPGNSFTRDALGRMVTLTHSDGAHADTTYAAAAIESQDEGNGTTRVTRIEQGNGLGQLGQVCEVTGATDIAGNAPAACGLDLGATGFLTTYVHDPLGNLTKVNQGAESRSYQFDALSRLTQSSDPESGATAYTYDSDSNVATRIRPRANQTSANVTTTTTYQWDELGRLLNSSYSDGTPSRNVVYDQATQFGGVALGDSIGQMTYASAGGASEMFAHDQMGRPTWNWQQTLNGDVYQAENGYDLAGDLDIATTGTGLNLTVAYNLAQRPYSLTSSHTDATHPAAVASAVAYNAFGEPLSILMGNGITETTAFDSRGRMTGRGAGSVYQLSGIQYEPDGNVWNVPTESVMGWWTYGYDELNRLRLSSGPTTNFTYAYDRYGNRWQQNVTAGSGPGFSQAFDSNNHIVGYSYDAAGNVIGDRHCGYSYDAENELTAVSVCASASYVYDAEGRRARSTVGGTSTDRVFYLNGRASTLIAYPGGSPAGLSTDIFFGDRLIATDSPSSTVFHHPDWLGTERAGSTYAGGLDHACSSLPFGDGFSCSPSDPSILHFAGQEHDFESGLDYFNARHYSANQGRFLSPDPLGFGAADPGNPATWNQYAYTANNPLNFIDPSGMDEYQVYGATGKTCLLDGIPTDCGNVNLEAENPCSGCDENGEPAQTLFYSPVNGLPYELISGPDGFEYIARNGEEVAESDDWEELAIPDFNLYLDGQSTRLLAAHWNFVGTTAHPPNRPPFKPPAPLKPFDTVGPSFTKSHSYLSFLACEWGQTVANEDHLGTWAFLNGSAFAAFDAGNLKSGLTLGGTAIFYDYSEGYAIRAACTAANY